MFLPFTFILTVVLSGLKYFGYIGIAWGLVALPLLIDFSLIGIINTERRGVGTTVCLTSAAVIAVATGSIFWAVGLSLVITSFIP